MREDERERERKRKRKQEIGGKREKEGKNAEKEEARRDFWKDEEVTVEEK